MANTLDLRRRIRSIKNTQQVTRAMKMVSAARLRRAQDRVIAARPFSAAAKQMLASVASRVEAGEHPLLRTSEEKKVLLLVIAGDKGLAGAFNINVLKAGTEAVRERGWSDVQLIPIGRKANDFFRRRGVQSRYQATDIFQALTRQRTDEIASVISSDFMEQKVDAVYAVYNEFRSVISQVVRVERLLPLDRQALDPDAPQIDYLYEPSADEILKLLLPKHIEFQIYRMLLDSAAAEHAARMTAMEGATKNAGELIDALTLSYNRARQASITKELIEIVSGAAALE